jgi:cytochrome c biogenesis protein CcmG, thiol:disulfide interchange protein DsbE
MATLKKYAGYGGVAVALAILLVFVMPTYRQGEASIAGRQAEDFAIQLDGRPAHFSDLKGKVIVLNFWATWCPPCVEETPALNELQQRIAARGGMVLGVSADEDPGAYTKFLKEQNVVFKTYRDPSTTGSVSPIAKSYGTLVYPETYIIDRHGKIARKIIGFQQWNSPDMLAYFDALLGQS